MKKGTIKVIKRKDVAEKTRVAAIKAPANTDHNLAEAVNGWIFDLQENRGKEKVYSDNKILSWKLLPKDFEKTIS